MEHQALLSSQPVADSSGARRSLAGLLVLAACIGSLAGCAPLGSKDEGAKPPIEEPARRGAPDWAGMPLGWQKLVEIERWLREDAQRYDPFWRVQGELILNEGRVAFAQDDLAAGKIEASTLQDRVQLARQGFQNVLADPRANAAQRARAEQGLAHLEGLAPPPAAQTGSLAMVPRSAWHARPPILARLDPVGGTWMRITVHHSDAVPGTKLDGTLADSLAAVQKIQRNHQENEGWGDIGYHYLIDADGRLLEGRSLQFQGAHAGGQNNVRNLGVCMLGDFERRAPTPQALATLEELLDELRAKYSIPRGNVLCHRDLKNTVCPGDPVAAWVRGYEHGAGPATASSNASKPKATPAAWKSEVVASSSKGSGSVR